MGVLTPRKAGYATIDSPTGRIEIDTITCSHCGNVRPVRTNGPLPVDPGGHCRICDHAICGQCADIAGVQGCIPFKRRIEEYERRSAFLRSVGVE